MDARGLADRGDGQLNDALTPTRVRGQISPGGPMPSITLRGVSIRGESRVQLRGTRRRRPDRRAERTQPGPGAAGVSWGGARLF
jgi:hypothetical protein